MSSLPREILREILSFLSLSDRIRLERVSKFWCSSSGYNDVTQVNFGQVLINQLDKVSEDVDVTCNAAASHRKMHKATYKVYPAVLWQSVLTSIIFRTGKNLKSISFRCAEDSSGSKLLLTPELFNFVNQQILPCLQDLSFENVLILNGEKFLVEMNAHCPSLRGLSLVCIDCWTQDPPGSNLQKSRNVLERFGSKLSDVVTRGLTQLETLHVHGHIDLRVFLRDVASKSVTKISIPNIWDKAELVQLVQGFPQLTSLTVSEGIRAVVDYTGIASLQQLEHLEMPYSGVCDEEMEHLIQQLPLLKSVNVESCPCLKEFNWFHQSEQLRELNIAASGLASFEKSICDPHLEWVVRNNPVEKLNLTSTRITDLGLEYIARYGTQLKSLNITNIEGNIEKSVFNIIEKCQNLSELTFSTDNIDPVRMGQSIRRNHRPRIITPKFRQQDSADAFVESLVAERSLNTPVKKLIVKGLNSCTVKNLKDKATLANVDLHEITL